MNSAAVDYWLHLLTVLQSEIRELVRESMQRQTLEASSELVRETAGDVIFAIDKVSEDAIVEFFAANSDPEFSFVLVAEGISDSQSVVFPPDIRPAKARYRLIIDPIDGTRSVMYDKRSAWALAGVAGNRGADTTLADIELAVQTEIPASKQEVSDVCRAVRGEGVEARRIDLRTGAENELILRPSSADTIEQGYASIVRFCPGPKQLLGALEEEMVDRVFGGSPEGRCLYFEDQYISTGGELYELMSGHDRFVADLRGLTASLLSSQGRSAGLCCHPYDVCTELIAREAGVLVTDQEGRNLNAPLDTTSEVSWLGYANPHIRQQLEPVLSELFGKHFALAAGSTR